MTCWPGERLLADLSTDGLFGDTGNKILGHLEVDIGLKKGHAHLAHGLLDIVFSQLAMAAEFFENTLPACLSDSQTYLYLSVPEHNGNFKESAQCL